MSAEARSRVLRTIKGAAAKPAADAKRTVVYWMSRDQRVQDNWALLHARDVAMSTKSPLAVVFCLTPGFPGATLRSYEFLLRGLEEVEASLKAIGVPFFMLPGDPAAVLPAFASKVQCHTLVSDFSPMLIKKMWARKLYGVEYPPADPVRSNVAVAPGDVPSDALPATVERIVEVDAHNVVPVWVTSTKREHAARTIRPKVTSHLGRFLKDCSEQLSAANTGAQLPSWPADVPQAKAVDWKAMRRTLKVDLEVTPVSWCKPGEAAALAAARAFAESAARLKAYETKRNDPAQGAQSDLSPYLHYGHLSAQRLALMAKTTARGNSGAAKGVEEFIEELIVRGELTDNFVYYSPDQPVWPEWAVETLKVHEADKREYLYTEAQLEFGKTHDELWNAAQHEMVLRGKMAGFMRMYWAKKILEWTPNAATAYDTALRLNDRYELDGRDPNGICGVAWSIYGIHDMGWTERAVFGKIRYMNYAGCKRKFDIGAYVGKVRQLVQASAAQHPVLSAKCLGPKPGAPVPPKAVVKPGQVAPGQPSIASSFAKAPQKSAMKKFPARRARSPAADNSPSKPPQPSAE